MFNWRHIIVQFIVIMALAGPLRSGSFSDSIKNIFSFKVSKKIFDSVNKSLVGHLRAKSIRFVLPNKLELEDFDVLDEDGTKVLSAKRVKAVVSLASLLTSNIKISDAYVDGISFYYTIKNQVHNVIRVFEPKPPAQPNSASSSRRVTIAKVRVENGSFHMQHDSGVEIFANAIRASGSFWVEDGPFSVEIGQADISSGTVNVGTMRLPITNLVAKNLKISDEAVSSHVEALYEQAKIIADGTVFIDKDIYDVRASIDAPQDTYPAGLTALPFKVPKFLGKVQLSGQLEDPQIKADVDFGSMVFHNLEVKSGRASAHINSHKILIDTAAINIGNQGTMKAFGEVDIDNGKFEFVSDQRNIQVAELAKFLSFEKKTTGQIEAHTKLSGSLFKKHNIISVKASGVSNNASLENLKISGKSQFSVDLDYVFDENVFVRSAKIRDDLGLALAFRGKFDLVSEHFKFDYDLKGHRLQPYIALESADATKFSSAGTLLSQNKMFSIYGKFNAGRIDFKKYLISDIVSEFNYGKNSLMVTGIEGGILGGKVKGDVAIDDLVDKKVLTGQLELSDVQLTELSHTLGAFPILGQADAKLDLSSTVDNPNIGFSGQIDNMQIDKFSFANLDFNGYYKDDFIYISKLDSITKAGTIFGENLEVGINTQKIAGSILLDNVDTAVLLAKYFKNNEIKGFIDGKVEIEGTFPSPSIKAPLEIKETELFGLRLGIGNLRVALEPEGTPSQEAGRTVVTLAANFTKESAKSSLRAVYSMQKKAFNAKATLLNVEFDTTRFPLPVEHIGSRGSLDGEISLFGTIEEPQLKAHIIAKEYTFFDPRKVASSTGPQEKYGPAILSAELLKGKLTLDLCASLAMSPNFTECNSDKRFTLSAAGPFNFDAYNLNLSGTLSHNRLEDIFFELKNELVSVGVQGTFKGGFHKETGKPSDFSLSLDIDQLLASMPNIPRIELSEPAALKLSNNRFVFARNAMLMFFPGQLEVGGSYSSEKIDLAAKGSIPLVLSRLIAPMIQQAEGLASGEINLSGKPEALLIEGNITPNPGSVFRFRRWIEPVEMKSGSINFQKTSENSFVSILNDVRMTVGDGSLFVNGSYNKSYKDDFIVGDKFNLDIEGNNVVFRNDNDFIEADFKISTTQKSAGESVLTGDLIVTDGFVHRQFGLRNFIAEAEASQRPIGLDFLNNLNLNLDLKLSVRQFLATARMLNFDIEATLAGQLTVQGSLAKPKIGGELIVTQGSIDFPDVTAELSESRIEMDGNSGKGFDPKISIVATHEFFSDEYPDDDIKQDTVVELSLKGDINRLVLDLKPISGEMGLSRTKIFLLLLLPRSLPIANSSTQQLTDVLKRGAQNAAMAFSGEVFLRPLTNELQDIISKRTNTRIRFGSALEAGGFSLNMKWELGPRVEMSGSYMLTNRENNVDNPAPTLEDFHPLGDVRLKLLLFDHYPFGPLYLENSFGAVRMLEGMYKTRAKIGLKYTVFSK